MTRKIAAGTVAAKNYISFARVLARSFRAHRPEIPFYVLLCDEAGENLEPDEPFELIPFSALAVPEFRNLVFRYPRHLLSIAAKPYLLEHLLGLGYEQVCFFDSDILITGDLSPILRSTGESAISLTPHLLEPPRGSDRAARELAIIRAGTFNAGFISATDDPAARRFINWWRERLRYHCNHDVARGVHGDQRWLDLAHSFFEEVSVVRDPGCNVAYWNLPERNVRFAGDTLMVDEGPCRFFHFSGFSPEAPRVLTRHPNSVPLCADLEILLQRYAELLLKAGFIESKQWTYAWQTFDNGVPIPDVAREEYRKFGREVDRFGDPFSTDHPQSFYEWLRETPDEKSGISRIWDAVYRHRVDVQRAFPDHHGSNLEAFLQWTRLSGAREHGITEAFLGQREASRCSLSGMNGTLLS